jgi:hypothetical protein
MSEKPARQPMTDGEREILFQIQQLQAKWFDTIEQCFRRELNHRESIQELTQQVQKFRDECLEATAYCNAELLRHVRLVGGLSKTIELLTLEVKELKQQLTKDRLF